MKNCSECPEYCKEEMLCNVNLFQKNDNDFQTEVICLLRQIVQELRFFNIPTEDDADISDWWKNA